MMLKQIFGLCLLCLLALFATTKAVADSGWEISFKEKDQIGCFVYTLYYPHSSQVISKVSLPQDQSLRIIDVKHKFNNEKGFISFRYGGTRTEIKGKGSDSDWTIEGSDILTDYGVMDVYGDQKLVAIDMGTVLTENEFRKVKILIGWVRQETTNELRNVIYQLIEGVEVGNHTQPDNGSYLNGEFSGLIMGINQDLALRPNLIFTTGLNLSFLNIKAYGHWANHSPAWNWEDTGRAVGYGASFGLKYVFNSNVQAELGYCYNYAKSSGCKEILNGDLLAQLVDLEYERKGWHGGLIILF